MPSAVLLLPYLLFMDFGGATTGDYTTQHCFAICSNSAIRSCNRVYNTAIPNIGEIISIKNYFGTTPFSWLVQDTDNETIALLEQQGLHYKASFAAMSNNIMHVQRATYHPNIAIHEVTNDAQLHLWISIVAQSFGYSESEFAKSIMYLMHKGASSIQLYLGLLNEKAVGAGMIIKHKDIISMHTIGTLSEYRGNGIGYALTHTCLMNAQKQGFQRALLIASDMAYAMYRKMGFEEYARYKVYGN